MEVAPSCGDTFFLIPSAYEVPWRLARASFLGQAFRRSGVRAFRPEGQVMVQTPSQRGYLPIEEMEVFRRYVEIADWVWTVVSAWQPLARDTVGKQLIRAIDSVGANLVEGDGRGSDAEAAHFFLIARASAREARYWLERAISRHLIEVEAARLKIDELTSATQLLNRLITYRRTAVRKGRVTEAPMAYDPAGPDPSTAE